MATASAVSASIADPSPGSCRRRWPSHWRAMISATIYQPYVFGVSPSFVDDRVIFSFDLWLTQFTAVGAILGLAGVMFLWSRMKGFAAATLTTLLALTVYTIAYNSFDAYVFLVPVFIVFALWIAAGVLNLATIARLAAAQAVLDREDNS